jgi:hypothetical protein
MAERGAQRPILRVKSLKSSVPDPDPDTRVLGLPDPDQDPLVKMYGSGSGSFYYQAKIVGKTLIPTVL